MPIKNLILKAKILNNYFKILVKQLKVKHKTENNRCVYFNLSERNVERYYYALIFFFYAAGYKIYLKNNFYFIASCMGDGKRIFSLPALSITNSLQPSSDIIYITDNAHGKWSQQPWKKIFVINFDIYAYQEKENHLWLPYPMSPHNYQVPNKRPEHNLRTKERKKSIFFSGNTSKNEYTNPVIKTFFNKVNRFEVIQAIKSELSADELIIFNGSEQQDDRENLLGKFILKDWQWSPEASKNLAIRVRNEEWLESLAKSNFFLACPGVTMPMCHNIVEAMSVGTIPITEYPEYFNPPLVHKVNCLVYNGKEDLIIKVRQALQARPEEVQQMRANAINYYEENLTAASFISKVENIKSKYNTLYMNGENVSFLHHSRNL